MNNYMLESDLDQCTDLIDFWEREAYKERHARKKNLKSEPFHSQRKCVDRLFCEIHRRRNG